MSRRFVRLTSQACSLLAVMVLVHVGIPSCISAQNAPLATPLAVARDAATQVLQYYHTNTGRATRESRPLRANEATTIKNLTLLAELMRQPAPDSGTRVFPDLSDAGADSVARCASQDERLASFCYGITPRTVVNLQYVAAGKEVNTVWVQITMVFWEQSPRVTAPSTGWTVLQYRQDPDGLWRFDRVVVRAAS